MNSNKYKLTFNTKKRKTKCKIQINCQLKNNHLNNFLRNQPQ